MVDNAGSPREQADSKKELGQEEDFAGKEGGCTCREGGTSEKRKEKARTRAGHPTLTRIVWGGVERERPVLRKVFTGNGHCP